MTVEKALEILDAEKYLFITGSGGCGKSTLTRGIIEHYKAENKSYCVTGSTGLAARSLDDTGSTIHSTLSLGISDSIASFNSSKFVFARAKVQLVTLDLLILDEVSMLSSEFFDLIFYKLEKENFTGKIIIIADFLQLKPVSKKIGSDGRPLGVNFAFESKHFAKFKTIYLTENHRLADGNTNFELLLERVRRGQFNIYDEQELTKYKVSSVDSENKTVLVASNEEATSYNMQELSKIEGEVISNRGRWSEIVNTPPPKFNLVKAKEDLIKNIIPPELFVYKIGCKVLITANSPDGSYVNGDRGKIIRFDERGGNLVVEKDNGDIISVGEKSYNVSITKNNQEYVIISFYQFPLVLASSITIHKSQGLTIRKLDIDCSRIFTEGQFYVALSRISHPENLGVFNFQSRFVKADMKAVNFYNNLDNLKRNGEIY